jgi:hypothetical protein
MSRSTPLSNLPNANKESSNAYDQNENALVKEILQEIDTDKNQQPNQLSPQQKQYMMEQQMMEHNAMMEQQTMMEQQQAINQQPTQQEINQHEINQHMNEQELMNNQMADNTNQQQNLSLVDKIKLNIKQPLVVALIAIIVSVPALTNMLENMIKSKASLATYATIIILVVKGLIAGGLYFGINKSI